MENNRKTALITGAGRGIGRAIAIAFCKKGYNVVIGYAGNDEAANETKRLCEEAVKLCACHEKEKVDDVQGEQHIALVKGDVSLGETAEKLTECALSFNGRIDVLVNNAGITRDTLLARMSEEDFDNVINTNLRGAFLLSKSVTKPMMKQRFGRIINISSVVGVHGNAGQVNYSASKAGLIGMTKSIAKELASRNITANAIAPGMIATDMTEAMTDKAKEAINASIPAKRMGTPEDVANAVLFLADENSGYITGQVLGIDGGMGM
ncbi:MAG: 3-oxoacyl-[acyl-carrier-protein] reductase [Lachnospiraceae bacterium]|nr:3-oxoacyl-[acyl-carrier-protein] reductase [Lachnospiraceae bacterium]